MMNRKLLIVAIIGAIMATCAFAKEENHVGYSLIKNLQLDSLEAINTLEDQWKTQKTLLQSGIDSWQNTVNDQAALCDSRSSDLAKTTKDVETTEAYIQWINNKIAENNARVQTLEEWRCTANTLYVNGIKNNKLTLSLIEYLYKELSTAKNLEMLQKMHVMTKLTVFIEAYKLGNVAALLDAPVFAQFKSHLKSTDGEEEEEEFGADDEEALEEIEDELEEDEEESENEGGSHSFGSDESGHHSHHHQGGDEGSDDSYSGSYEDSEDEEVEDGEELHAVGAHHEDDGEWEDEDEDEEEDDEEEFEDDEEEEDDEGTEEEGGEHHEHEDSEEGGEHHHHHGHHEEGDEEEDDEEEGEHHHKGHHFESGSSISYKGEQSNTGAPSAWTHKEWDVDTSSWPQFKKDLLDILVQLRNSIIHKMKTAQDDEVNAGIALADYKVIIHRENEDLERALVNQQNRLEDLLVLQTKQQIKVTECQAELSTVSDSLYASQAELQNSEAQFTENRKAAIDERDIYDYVVSLYEGKVEDRFRFKGDNRNSRQLDNIN